MGPRKSAQKNGFLRKLHLTLEISATMFSALVVILLPVKPLILNIFSTFMHSSEVSFIKTFENEGLYISQPSLFKTKDSIVKISDIDDICGTVLSYGTRFTSSDVSNEWTECIATQFVQDVVNALGREHVTWQDTLQLNIPFSNVLLNEDLERRRVANGFNILNTFYNPSTWGAMKGTWVFRDPTAEPVDALETLEGWVHLFNITLHDMVADQLPGYEDYLPADQIFNFYYPFMTSGLDCYTKTTLHERAKCVAKAYPMNMYQTVIENKLDSARLKVFSSGVGFNVLSYYELALSADSNSAGLGLGRCKAAGTVPTIVQAVSAGGALCRMILESFMGLPSNGGWGANARSLPAFQREIYRDYYMKCLPALSVYPEFRSGKEILKFYDFAELKTSDLTLVSHETLPSDTFKPWPEYNPGVKALRQANEDLCEAVKSQLKRPNCSLVITYAIQGGLLTKDDEKPVVYIAGQEGKKSNRIFSNCDYMKKQLRKTDGRGTSDTAQASSELLRMALSKYLPSGNAMTGIGVLFDLSCTSTIGFGSLRYDSNLFISSQGCMNTGILQPVRFSYEERCADLALEVSYMPNDTYLVSNTAARVSGEMGYAMATQSGGVTGWFLMRGPRLSCIITTGILGTNGLTIDNFNKERLADLRQYNMRVHLDEGSIRLVFTAIVAFTALVGMSFTVSYVKEATRRVRVILQQLKAYPQKRFLDAIALRYIECSAYVIRHTSFSMKALLVVGTSLNLAVITMGSSNLEGSNVVLHRFYAPLTQVNYEVILIFLNLLGMGQIWMRRGIQRLGNILWDMRTTRFMYVTMIGLCCHQAGVALQILFMLYAGYETLYIMALAPVIIVVVTSHVSWGISQVPVMNISELGSLGAVLSERFDLKTVDLEKELTISHTAESSDGKAESIQLNGVHYVACLTVDKETSPPNDDSSKNGWFELTEHIISYKGKSPLDPTFDKTYGHAFKANYIY